MVRAAHKTISMFIVEVDRICNAFMRIYRAEFRLFARMPCYRVNIPVEYIDAMATRNKTQRNRWKISPPKQSYDGWCFSSFRIHPLREHHILSWQLLMALLVHDSILSVYSFKASHLVSTAREMLMKHQIHTDDILYRMLGMRNILS